MRGLFPLCCLHLLACAHQLTPLEVATATAVAGKEQVDAATHSLDAQIEADLRPRLAPCGVDAACLDKAKEATRAALGPRITIGLQLVVAQRQAVTAVRAARACDTDSCRTIQTAAITVAEAEVARLLVQLEHTPPVPGQPAPTPAPAMPVTPAPTTPKREEPQS